MEHPPFIFLRITQQIQDLYKCYIVKHFADSLDEHQTFVYLNENRFIWRWRWNHFFLEKKWKSIFCRNINISPCVSDILKFSHTQESMNFQTSIRCIFGNFEWRITSTELLECGSSMCLSMEHPTAIGDFSLKIILLILETVFLAPSSSEAHEITLKFIIYLECKEFFLAFYDQAKSILLLHMVHYSQIMSWEIISSCALLTHNTEIINSRLLKLKMWLFRYCYQIFHRGHRKPLF